MNIGDIVSRAIKERKLNNSRSKISYARICLALKQYLLLKKKPKLKGKNASQE